MKLENKSIAQLKKTYWQELSKLIRLEIPHCEVCKYEKSLFVHHLIKRSKGNVVYLNRSNLVAVCKSCHFMYHNVWSPKEVYDMNVELRGDGYLDVEHTKHRAVKFSKYELIESIKITREKIKQYDR